MISLANELFMSEHYYISVFPNSLGSEISIFSGYVNSACGFNETFH